MPNTAVPPAVDRVQIRSPEFLGDVKHVLRSLMARGLFPAVKLGHLDEAVASGFGYKSRAAALTDLKSGPVTVRIDDAGFRARLSEFGGVVTPGVFHWNVVACLTEACVTAAAVWPTEQAYSQPLPPDAIPGTRVLRDAHGGLVLEPLPEPRTAGGLEPRTVLLIYGRSGTGRTTRAQAIAARAGEFWHYRGELRDPEDIRQALRRRGGSGVVAEIHAADAVMARARFQEMAERAGVSLDGVDLRVEAAPYHTEAAPVIASAAAAVSPADAVLDEEDGEEDDGWIDPETLDPDDPLRMAWEHDKTSRGWR